MVFARKGFLLPDALQDLDLLLEQNAGSLDVGTYAALLRRFGQARSLSQGKRLHDHIISRSSYDGHTFLGNLLVQMYGNCGSPENAWSAFNRIRHPNVFSWNLLIQAYSANGCFSDAKDAFWRMPQRDAVSWTSIMNAYAQNGYPLEARLMFDRMPQWDSVSWTSMMTAYALNGHLGEAKCLFDEMPVRDAPCWNGMLTAYSQKADLAMAKLVFEKMPHWSILSWNAMISGHVYSECEQLEEAKRVFDGMPERNGVSWAGIIGAFCRRGKLNETEKLFGRMPSWNLTSCTAMIEAYAQFGYVQQAKSLFDSMPEQDLISKTAMLVCYASNAELEGARKLFDSLLIRDVICWNAMISAYAHMGHHAQACQLFGKMDLEGTQPDFASFVAMLDSCASSTSLKQGRLVHSILRECGAESNSRIATSLINMYGKSGLLSVAKEVFKNLYNKELISWTAMVAAYGLNGEADKALWLFSSMLLEGIQPDHIMFICVLCVCNHGGMFEHGQQHFCSLQLDFSMSPVLDHYVCMVDLLGRAGYISQAQELLEDLENFWCIEPHGAALAWTLLLSACKMHGDLGRAEAIANRLENLMPETGALYVLLSQLYRAQQLFK